MKKLPSEWKLYPLNDLLKLNQSGKWGTEGTEKDFPVLRSTNIQNNELVLEEVAYRKILKPENFILQSGDILVTKSSGSKQLIGKCCIFKQPNNNKKYLFSNFVQRLRSNEKISNEFLYYFLISPWGKANLQKLNETTSGLRNLDMKGYSKQLIPVPKESSERYIVTILEKIRNIRHQQEKILVLLQDFTIQIFLKMFGDPISNFMHWPKQPFAKIAEIDRIGIKPNQISNNTKYVGLEHIEKESGRLIEVISIKKGFIKSNKFIFSKNHILYGKLRPYLNKVAFPNFDGVCSTDIIPISVKEQLVTKKYLGCLMRQKSFVENANSKSTGGNLPRLSVDELMKFEIPVPPLKLQNNFTTSIDLVHNIIDYNYNRLKQITIIFNTLLQKSFDGLLY